MVILAKVTNIGPMTTFNVNRQDGTTKSIKKKTLVVENDFNSMACEAFDDLAQELEDANLVKGVHLVMDITITCVEVASKQSGETFLKNNVRINKVKTL